MTISEATLFTLRRGAEQLVRKYADQLADKEIVMAQEVAKDLGILAVEHNPGKVPAVPQNLIGVFDDEPTEDLVVPQVMTKVKLVDYVNALKSFKPKTPQEILGVSPAPQGKAKPE